MNKKTQNNQSFFVTLLIIIAAPLSVAIPLGWLNKLWLVFVLYHIFFSLLLAPIDLIILKKKTFKEYLLYIGISTVELKDNIKLGFLIGISLCISLLLSYIVLGDLLIKSELILNKLTEWGISTDNVFLMLIFMLAFNGVAEELFWRGYIHKRLEHIKERFSAINLAALYYASYHAFILMLFVKNVAIALAFTFIVYAAGIFWGLLREKYNSVIPAAISHTGATLGYMMIFWIWIA